MSQTCLQTMCSRCAEEYHFLEKRQATCMCPHKKGSTYFTACKVDRAGLLLINPRSLMCPTPLCRLLVLRSSEKISPSHFAHRICGESILEARSHVYWHHYSVWKRSGIASSVVTSLNDTLETMLVSMHSYHCSQTSEAYVNHRPRILNPKFGIATSLPDSDQPITS